MLIQTKTSVRLIPLSAKGHLKPLVRQSCREPLPIRASGFAMTVAAAAGVSGRNNQPTSNSWFVARPVVLGS